ncbi:MAG: septal ring lytic transglycosylase RlpA family protein [Deltaproteobacteria bacterium]|nr:septal ring lytic transglycosylase RlpA family protein [Deltaproteobacteria bacterium]
MRTTLYKSTCFCLLALTVSACSVVTAPYRYTKKTVKGGIWLGKATYNTGKVIYHVGKYTYIVVKAPFDWPLTNDIKTIDGLSPKEAIRQGRVKNAPYTVKGRKYYPMSVANAENYEATGIASWYGYETRNQRGGHMTANGEAFNPKGLTAAHKHLPLPMYVKVTNLENRRSIIVRVNDRGPFPSDHNASSGKRIIDLSMGAAKKIGFYEKGTARVRVEAVEVDKG